jgi:hypothetical protein
MVYLFCGLFGGALIAAVVSPLFRKEHTLESTIIEETEWDLLQRKKEVVLANIQDLDFEFKCGKLSTEDYNKVRSEMSVEAAAVLREIDEIEHAHDLDALIRREMTARRNRKSDNLQQRTCPVCGSKNPASNKFCAECGGKISK